MKKMISALMVMLINGIILGFISCSEQDELLSNTGNINGVVTDTVMKTCDVIFNVNLTEFDQTRASSDGWVNGDRVYLTFDNSAYGVAEYNSEKWSINYFGTLTKGKTVKCEVIYFSNTEFENSSMVQLTSSTSIYEDLNAVYAFDGTTLSVTAALTPKTGRMRFKGTADSTIIIHGITHYTSYGVSTGLLSESPTAVTLKVEADGYTPYVYGYFTDSISPRINLISYTNGYNRQFPKTIYKKGESGYIDIPTDTLYQGWVNDLNFKIDTIEFKLIPVHKDNNVFYLGETEVTAALYYTIMGGTWTSPYTPIGVSSVSVCNTFINKLYVFTELPFRLPTKAEWQYAANGGNQSQGYIYSGSNMISEVAWYSSNSGSKRHKVAQLKPNELGFYDMSGNMCEWTSTKSGDYYYCCGGYFDSDEGYCKTTSASQSYNSSNVCGLRLALSIN